MTIRFLGPRGLVCVKIETCLRGGCDLVNTEFWFGWEDGLLHRYRVTGKKIASLGSRYAETVRLETEICVRKVQGTKVLAHEFPSTKMGSSLAW